MQEKRVTVTMRLPPLLRQVAGKHILELNASTLVSALEEAYDKIPALRHHMCQESGEFRKHVLCFYNGNNTKDMPSLDIPLSDGDEIEIAQAISGG